ncbi:hypothetical protein HMPREF1550_01125 [Actinomyces sp. oral taxon 877 str. F0543]|nr:hypothetical protein HMPREF1550_01125 [Actinomyces sp. oral taxon 877 str. F0543]
MRPRLRRLLLGALVGENVVGAAEVSAGPSSMATVSWRRP